MIRTTLTSRVVRLLALTALVATPVVVLGTGGSAGAAEVSDQNELREAFEDDLVSQIDLTADITIDPSGDEGCDQIERDSDVSLLVEGHGFTISKDEAACELDGQEGERIFRQYGNGTITFQNVTVTGGTKIGGAGGALKTDGPVVVTNALFGNNQAINCDLDSEGATATGEDDSPGGASYCGDAEGGAIYAEGSVTVSVSEFSSNHADEAGGAVFTEANMIVESSVFFDNSATFEGECWCSGGGWIALGGSDVTGSDISDNDARCDAFCGGSGAGFWSAGPASVVGSSITGNEAGCEFACEGVGGGFSASGFGAKSFAAEDVADVGAAAADPGQIIVADSTIADNVATCGVDEAFIDAEGDGYSCGSGGGFYAFDADLVDVSQSTLAGNQAICVFDLEIIDATDTGLCGAGGAIFTQYVEQVTVTASTLNDNFATLLGGAYANGGLFIAAGLCELDEGCEATTLDMLNSTVTANTTGFVFGAITMLGEGDTFASVHNTIVGNIVDITDFLEEAAASAEVEAVANVAAFRIESFGTIVALPIGVPSEIQPVVGNCVEEETDSQGYNFSDDDTCGFDDSTDNVNTPNDPELEPLGAYGGPTNTMRPEGEIQGTTVVSLSPVVDQIPAERCVIDVDQRGVSRPQTVIADACDIGSVEITAAEITISPEVVAVPLEPRFTG